MTSLFDPISLGAIHCVNRIFMAPLTRGRATQQHVPTPLMVDYYRQRAAAGLIISEATGISQQGLGWPFAPGIWNDEQVEAWKPVTAAVHEAGGRIVCQLWHMGRLVHPDFLGGDLPVSSSAVQAPHYAHTYEGKKDYAVPRPLAVGEIPAILADYAQAARNAIAAGFDGVQIHAANGYLIDQFLRDTPNQRTDDYGGSVENRVRLLREVAGAVVDAIGADRTGVRLSPNGDTQGCDDSDPVATFTAAAAALDTLGIAFLELREQRPDGTFGSSDVPPVSPHIRKVFHGPLALNGDYGPQDSAQVLAEGRADAIAFGRWFISNPDLPARLKSGVALAPYDMQTFYSRGPEGYTDYPAAG